MKTSKEQIVSAALHAFARSGFEAVSTGMIAENLGITKGALYRHFENKRAILGAAVRRMEERDAELAAEERVPETPFSSAPESYRGTAPESVLGFTLRMFRYWTEDPFASDFRKMLVLEQYRNPEMASLLGQYLTSGPVSYLEDLFAASGLPRTGARQKALSVFGLFWLSLTLSDHASDRAQVLSDLETGLRRILLGRGKEEKNEN